jgi:multidrug resistance efflux pump
MCECGRGRQGAVAAAIAAKDAAEAQISTLLPAQMASAEAALARAEVDLAKTVIRAGVRVSGAVHAPRMMLSGSVVAL